MKLLSKYIPIPYVVIALFFAIMLFIPIFITVSTNKTTERVK